MAKSKKTRVDLHPAFILHQYPYRETSTILEIFSQGYGRFSLIARGARRAGSSLRGILTAFQPLLFSWFGSGELKTLYQAVWQGGIPQLTGLPLLCGFYLNELLMKLLPRDEAASTLFSAYFHSIRSLSKQENPVEPVLRAFELTLLRELGYGFDLQREYQTGKPIEPDCYYNFREGCGLIRYLGAEVLGTEPTFSGQVALDLDRGDFSRLETLQQSKLLMRQALLYELNGKTIHTRKLLLELYRL